MENNNRGVLRDLTKARRINLFDVKKLKTGVRELDTALHGGIPFSQMTIIGSYEGAGKSTFVSQIITHALQEAANKVFVYSGEMPDAVLMNTISYQMAGVHTTSDCFGRSFVPNDIDTMIRDRYKGRIFSYGMTSSVNGKFERFKLDMKYACTELGCNIFIIDNLMSASDDLLSVSINENDRQAKISGYLAEFAAEHNVCVILVAHTRKEGNFQVQNPNDTISGSSASKNRAGLILFYSPLKKSDQVAGLESERRIQITKNRLYGHLNFEGIRVHYDSSCRRIYGDLDKDSYLKDFNCFTNESTFPADERLEEFIALMEEDTKLNQ